MIAQKSFLIIYSRAKIEASKCTTARLELVEDRGDHELTIEKKSNTLKEINSITSADLDQDPLTQNLVLTNLLSAKIKQITKQIHEIDNTRDCLSVFADAYLSRPPPVVSFFMGMDRYGRAYWWISPFGSAIFNGKNSMLFHSATGTAETDPEKYCFGVIVEDGFSSLSVPSYSATKVGTDLVNLLASLTHNGKRERSLAQHLNFQISKYCKIGDSDYREKIDLGVKKFREWLSAFVDGPPQDFNGISDYNSFFFPLVKGKVSKLGIKRI